MLVCLIFRSTPLLLPAPNNTHPSTHPPPSTHRHGPLGFLALHKDSMDESNDGEKEEGVEMGGRGGGKGEQERMRTSSSSPLNGSRRAT